MVEYILKVSEDATLSFLASRHRNLTAVKDRIANSYDPRWNQL